jgi:hypothetical protein
LRILNLETDKIVPNRSVPGRFEAFFRREYVQGAAPHWQQPGMAEKRDAFDEFHGTAVDDRIDLQERNTMLDLYGRHRERHWKMPISQPRPSDLCLSGNLDEGRIF